MSDTLWRHDGLLTPLAGGPPLIAAAFLFVPQLFGDAFSTVAEIDAITVRQVTTPEAVLGRVNSAFHLIAKGVAPIGALVGALVAEAFGIRAAVWVAALGSLAGVALLVRSPLPSLRTVAAVEAQ